MKKNGEKADRDRKNKKERKKERKKEMTKKEKRLNQ